MSYLECAIKAATLAGDNLKEKFESEFDYELKSDFQDLVTECDHVAEELIIKAIHSQFPDHSILGEESGVLDRSSEYCWVIDPIDGTTNFAHKIPIFAVSIALEHNGQILVAVLLDPMRDELFTAMSGEGAWLNENPMRISTAASLSESVIMAGFPYNSKLLDEYLEVFRASSIRAQGLRRLGSAALALAYVAAGRIDGFWTMNINLWDVAAGLLLIEEAGGKITGLDGNARDLTEKSMIASNGKIHDELVEMISGVRR